MGDALLPAAPNAPSEPMPALRSMLRALPVLAGDPVGFDAAGAPDDPLTLFVAWLTGAVEAGVPEPHAMTLSTVDPDGRPDARVLILKDVTGAGFWFATSAASAKGRQLAANPQAALTFYWPQLGRQVRVRGRVAVAAVEESAADFLARGVGARAVALASTESAPLTSRDECAVAVAAARDRVASTPDLVSPTWTLCVVTPDEVEFWQADPDRQHTRLRYTATPDRWQRSLVWP